MSLTDQGTARMMALKDLHPARGTPFDVRKSGNGDITELKASIKTSGLLFPLTVKEHEGRTIVVAGNRRLAALKEIYPNHAKEVPTVNADDFDGDTRVLAAATNISLPPHPMDRYELIAALIGEGMSPAEAQERFALSDKVFRQTMRLGSLGPKIREAYREGDIDGETARAFALTDDAKAQDKLFTLLQKTSHNGRIHAQTVTSRLGATHEVGRLVTFVGVSTVAAAGILKNEDLFGRNHDVTDKAKLQAMVDDRLNVNMLALTNDPKNSPRGGWSWAVLEDSLGHDRYQYGYEQPGKIKFTAEEKTRLDEISAALGKASDDEDDWTTEQLEMHEEHGEIEEQAKARAFTIEQRARSGCILSITHEGRLKIDYGRVKPQAARKAASESKDASKPKAAPKPGEVAVISARLMERLSGGLQEAVKSALEHDVNLSAAAMIAAFASGGKVLNVRAGNGSSGGEEDFVKIFEATKKASPQELLSMLMKVAQEAVSIVSFNPAAPPLDKPSLAALVGAMRPEVVRKEIARTFDHPDYFSSISVAGIADAATTAIGEQDGARVAKMSKKDAVSYAVEFVIPTGWLPKELRTVHYKGPVEAAPAPKKAVAKKAPAKKAAPVKKPAKKAAKKKAK